MRLTRWLAFGATACLSLSFASSAAASGPRSDHATRLRWRVFETLSTCPGLGPVEISSTGRANAWFVGLALAPGTGCPAGGIVAEHWNGSRWQPTSAAPPTVSGQDGLSLVIAGSSARDAWTFPLVEGTSANNVALHWDGSSWSQYAVPDNMTVTAAASFGKTNAWVFGHTSKGSITARFRGASWRVTRLPGEPLAVSAQTSRDMWAVGPTTATEHKPPTRQVIVAMHWTGRSWHTVHIPRRLVSSGEETGWMDLAAVGPKNIWWAYQLPGKHGSGIPGGRLLHWNGKRWSSIRVPRSVTYTIGGIAPDGHGGIWLNGVIGPGQGGSLRTTEYHYSGGSWSSRQQPPNPAGYASTYVSSLCWVPGTTELWASATSATSSSEVEGVIYRYGS